MSDDESVYALQDVERAIARVEKAVNDKWTSIHYIFAALAGVFLFSLPGQIWHAKWRYAVWYSVSSDKVFVDDLPHDCAFAAAPFGEKYCHYEREVSIVQWATSHQTGNPIISYDEGKTWSEFTPDRGVTVPQAPTNMEVRISWKKVNE